MPGWRKKDSTTKNAPSADTKMNAKIDSEIWDDPDFMELHDSEKLAVFWILTKVNLLGYVEITPRKFSRDIEAPFEIVEGACKGLPRGFVRTERGVWCRNYIRKQFGYGHALERSHMAKSIRKQLENVPDQVRILVLEEYPEISPDPKGLCSSLEATREGEGEIEIEIEEGGVGETPALPSLPHPPHPILARLRALFRIRPETRLDATTHKAWEKNKKSAAALTESDLSVLEWAYRQKEGDAAKYRRRDLATLLNNLTSEVTRSYQWSRAAGATPGPATEPEGWRDLIEREYPECNLSTWAALPESMKAFVHFQLRAAQPAALPAA
jgi:hypothetical protein